MSARAAHKGQVAAGQKLAHFTFDRLRNRSTGRRAPNVIGLHAKENEKAPGATAMRIELAPRTSAVAAASEPDRHYRWRAFV